jgi:2-polyprenyl-6-methoxyphenol hydroxylase-like FAD-dependent oxidoreductase
MQTGDRRERRGRAVVVGASLSGLMTALALSRAGMAVTILERVGRFPRTGAAIGVNDDVLARLGRLAPRERSTRTASGRPTQAPLAQTWAALHARLRAAADADPHIEVLDATAVQDVAQDAQAAWAITADGRTFRGDVVVGADGYRSVVRRRVAPRQPDATFAGYVLWLGVADEAAIPAPRRWPQDLAILDGLDACLLGYPLADGEGALVPGARQLGWAWYDATRNDLLRETGCVVDGVVRHSLASGRVPPNTLRELAEEARALWPAPWRDAILDSIGRCAVTGTPITEYVPDRLVDGRLVLVGDAAHVPTPMTGLGFATSLADAEALAECLASSRRGDSCSDALRAYERQRLGPARRLVQSGQQFSRSFARGAA